MGRGAPTRGREGAEPLLPPGGQEAGRVGKEGGTSPQPNCSPGAENQEPRRSARVGENGSAWGVPPSAGHSHCATKSLFGRRRGCGVGEVSGVSEVRGR